MIIKLSDHDLFVIIQCMSFIVDSGRYYPDDIHARIGIFQKELRHIRNWLQHLLDGKIDWSELESHSGISKDHICLGIHNSLGDVGFAEVYDDAEMKLNYGITKQEVIASFERWKKLRML